MFETCLFPFAEHVSSLQLCPHVMNVTSCKMLGELERERGQKNAMTSHSVEHAVALIFGPVFGALCSELSVPNFRLFIFRGPSLDLKRIHIFELIESMTN